ncbi:Hypp5974 [Branchiostoma lanceolatum]|uniref:Hypp5974 protein n=1 Tax=Branchiostoma lanceolatum TaxID=7740 RepID=A0A8J9YSN1_BRALA|nr:Hypp5974 [Branchiostoma lanceolatum]
MLTVEAEIHSSDKDDSTEPEKTTTEMCTACGRPVKDHVEAGSEFGPECKWRRKESTHSADPQEHPVDVKDVTSPPEAVPDGSSPPHAVSEDEIARLQAERDKLLRQYEVNRLQQEIAGLRAALGTSPPPLQALGATVGDLNAPPQTNITPSPPITLQDVKHQPKIQTALKKLSTSVELLNNMLGHSTDGDAYNGDQETLDTDQWSPSSSFIEKGRDPNSVESRTGYLRERLALQTHRLRLLSRKHNETRVGIDHVRDWLENSHAAHAVDEVKSGSTDSGVRSPAISPMSQFGGSMPDVNNTDGHRQRQQSRVPARSQSFQLGQQRPSTYNIAPRDQGTGEQLKYADPSIGVRSPTVSTTSPLSGSIPDVNSNAGQRHQSRNPARSQYFQSGQQRPSAYNITPRDQGLTRVEAFMRRRTLQNERVEYWNSKLIMNEKKRMQKTAVQNWLANHHTGQTPIDRRRHYSDTGGGQRGSLWSHGTTDGLDAIGEGVEEPLPEDANDEHIESRNPKSQAAKLRDTFPSTSPHEDRVSHKKGDGGKSDRSRSRSMDVDRKRPNRGQRPSVRNQSKLRSRGSTETSSGGKPGRVKEKEEQLIEGKQNPSRGLKRDQTSDSIGQKENTSTGWASMMSLATTADDAGKSGSAKPRLQDDKRVNWKTYKADEDVVKTRDTNAMSGFFGGFMNLVGNDEQKEKNPTEPGVPGWGEDTGRSHGKASDDSSSLGFLGGLTQSISLPWDKDEKIQEDRNYPFMGSFAGGEDGDNQEHGEPSVVNNLLRSFGGRHQKEEPGPGLIPAEMGSWKRGEDRGRAAADTNNQPVGFLRSLGQTFGVSPDESKQQETGSIFSNLLGSSEQRGGKHDGETPAWTDDIKGLIFGTRQYEDVPEDDRTQADLNILKIFGKKEDSGDNEGRRKSSIDPAMMSQMSEARGQNVEEESSFWNFLGLGRSDDMEPGGGDRRGDNPVRRGDNPVRDFFNDLF